MKLRKKTIARVIIVTLFCLSIIAPSAADLIDPNGKSSDQYVIINHCYIIENEDQYPGYVFGIYPWQYGGVATRGFLPFKTQQCFGSHYKFAHSYISAINRTQYNALSPAELNNYSSPSIIRSDYEAPVDISLAKPSTITSQTDVLAINVFNSTDLAVKKSRSFNTYLDGHTQDISLTAIPVIAGIVISLILIRKRCR